MIELAIPLLHVSHSVSAECFFCEKLGFRKVFSYRPDDLNTDPCYFGIMRDHALIHISSFAGDGVPGGVVCLRVDSVDSLYDEFLSKAVKIDLKPTDQTWGNREMYIKDSDKNCIRFIQEIQ